MWNLKKLTSGLKKYVENIHLETSGAYPISGKFDWICLSPKKQNLHLMKFCLKPMNLRLLSIISMILYGLKIYLKNYQIVVSYIYNLNGVKKMILCLQ